MESTPRPIGVREAKAHFSAIAEEVNATGTPLTVMRHGAPWIIIQPADPNAKRRRDRLAGIRKFTAQIEAYDEPAWDPEVSDDDLLAEERMARFG